VVKQGMIISEWRGPVRNAGRAGLQHADTNVERDWKEPNYPLVTYVTDGIASAMAQAKAAAGARNVMVHGAYTAQRALEAGVLDELRIHQIPVLFGAGRRLFELLPSRAELDIVHVIDTPQATHIRYRVRH
jgi:dihydrofolate reductase